jgi:hypothetical protein
VDRRFSEEGGRAMKKNSFILIIFLLLGLLTGSILSELLSGVHFLSFLTKSKEISWQPRADLNVLKYDFYFQVKLNLVSIIGLIAAFWIYRKI